MQNVVKESTITWKQELYERDLNFHTINPLIKPPEAFGIHPTLKTISKNVEAMKLFPQNKAKFTGTKRDGPSIAEFIFAVNYAQQRLLLSEEEFKDKLLNSTTDKAHKTIRTLLEQGDNVAAIYHKLIILYDDTPDPAKAKADLLKFKISRKSSLMEAQGKILELACAAARIFTDSPLRRAYSNSEAAQALIRALPPKSSQLVATQYNVLIAKNAHTTMEAPLFVDFILFLGVWRTEIDLDIQMNGVSFDFREQRERRYFPRSNQSGPRMMQVHATRLGWDHREQPRNNFYNNPRGQNYNNRVSVNALNSNGEIHNKYMNKMYCSLCAGTTHTAAQGCYKMKKGGVVYPVTPTQVPCSTCLQKLNKKLYHPPDFCFSKESNQTRSFQSNKPNSFQKKTQY